MPDNYCLDDFSISVSSTIDASIEIPGDLPEAYEPGSIFIIGFVYVTGHPPATAFDLEWEAVLGDGQSSNARPTATISPMSPITPVVGPPSQMQSGTITGTVPEDRDITYNATLWIRQA